VFTREDGEGLRPKRVSSAFTASTDRIGRLASGSTAYAAAPATETLTNPTE